MADDFIYQVFNILPEKHGIENQSHDLTFGSLSTLTSLCVHSISKVVSAPGSQVKQRSSLFSLGFCVKSIANGSLYFFLLII